MGAIKRGCLIVLEGCDKSGKSTQCNMLKKTLCKKGIPCELVRFPDRSTAIGKVINDYLERKIELDDHAIHLLFSANRWEQVSRMLELINNGTCLIVDRYAYSGAAFTAAKKGFTLDWCKQSDRGIPRPDLVLYLTLTPEEAAKRGDFGSERYEQTDFQKRVAQNYTELIEENWMEVDASVDIDNLHSILIDKILQVNSEKRDILQKLWTKA